MSDATDQPPQPLARSNSISSFNALGRRGSERRGSEATRRVIRRQAITQNGLAEEVTVGTFNRAESKLRNLVKREVNAQILQRYEVQVLAVQMKICIFVLLTLMFAVIENENYLREYINLRKAAPDDLLQFECSIYSKASSSTIRNILKIGTFIFSFLQVGCIVYYYFLLNKIGKKRPAIRQGMAPETAIMEMPVAQAPLECALCLCLVPPFVKDTSFCIQFMSQTAQYRYEAIALLVMMLRLLFILRYLRDKKAFSIKQLAGSLDKSGVSLSTKFVVKYSLSSEPLPVLTMAIIGVFIVASYAMRIGEFTLQMSSDQVYFWTNMWLMLEVITTVGYGDTYPRSHVGRTTTACTMIISMVVISLMTASLVQAIEYSEAESRVAHMINLQRWKEELQISSARLIQQWWRDKRKPGSVRPIVFAKIREAWKKAKRRVIRAIKNEESMEKALDKMVEKIRASTKLMRKQAIGVKRLELVSKMAKEEYELRFSAIESKVSSLHASVKMMKEELHELALMRIKLKETSVALRHAHAKGNLTMAKRI